MHRWIRLLSISALVALAAPATVAKAQEIRIGFGMSLTGPLAANGKSALLAHKIWEEEVNARGGLLGRKVRLLYYDDQSNPTIASAIYTKLLEVDKVDLVIGPYATAMIAPTMPIVIQKRKLLIGLMGLSVNAEFKYPNYFSMIPTGSNGKVAFTEGFFKLAMTQDPKPRTVAIVAADAEFAHNAAEGARENARAAGLRIIYDKTYPPATADFSPVVRALAAVKPDIVVVNSYPLDSLGLVKAVNAAGFKPKMIGGAMVGLQATAFKTQLGPLLNGWVNYDFWLPVTTINSPLGVQLMRSYQARAASEGVDPLGYYVAPWAYAQLQVLQQAIEATKTLKDETLAGYLRTATLHTVVGEVRFGADGEWAQPRVLQTQFRNIRGSGLDQFRTGATQAVLWPPHLKTGELAYPFGTEAPSDVAVPAASPPPAPVVAAPPPVAPAVRESVPAALPVFAAPPGRRVALVIGNSAYPAARLANPANDAADVAAALRKLGFEVVEGKDLTLAGFSSVLSSFADKAGGAEAAVLYYAGHAMQFEDQNWLMPVDAKVATLFDARRSNVPLQEVVAEIENKAKTTLVFLDACRDNPLADGLKAQLVAQGRGVAQARGLARVDIKSPQTLIVFATRPNTTAADGGGRNSPFTEAFLSHVATPGVEVEVLMKRVTALVAQKTGGRQQPERLSRLEQEFYFVPPR